MAFIFTTSWDDGSVLDLKTADLLSRYGMKGTFYIPKKFEKGHKRFAYDRRLTEAEVRSIPYEVGGHSLNHCTLTDISQEEARDEIVGSKRFLERVTGKPVKMFAPPRGKFNNQIINLIRDAGFDGARTSQKLSIKKGQFLLDATIICHPFPLRKLNANQYYWRRILDPLNAYDPKQFALSWQSLARRWFKKAITKGNYFHLTGHSWELEQYDMWQELESFLQFIKSHKNIIYLSNGEVVDSK